MGGLVQVNQQALEAERSQLQGLVARLRLDHATAELNLQGFMNEEEQLRNTVAKLQRYLQDHTRVMEDAYERRYISVAMGLELAHKSLRIELAVCFRDLKQKATNLMDAIKTTHEELSKLEFDIVRSEVRLQMIQSQLRPVASLNDALNNA